MGANGPFDPFRRVPNRSGGGDEAWSESDRPRPLSYAPSASQDGRWFSDWWVLILGGFFLSNGS